MISAATNLAVAEEPSPPMPIGLARLCKLAFDGLDLAPVWNQLVHRVKAQPGDAAALLDLSTIAQLQGRPNDRMALQAAALKLQRVYRQPAAITERPLRLLAFMAPGGFMANTPLEFMLEGSNITLDMIYVVPGMPLPEPPEHDIAFVAMDESDENQPVLRELAGLIRGWPRPVLNAPERIARLTRAGTWDLLKSSPHLAMPMNLRIDRDQFERVACGEVAIEPLLDGRGFPIIARPSWSQAGNGLAKLDDAPAVDTYLTEWGEADFYIAPFVDYRSADGLYRKYRVALIGGRPFACHMAISRHWMIHYLNADMKDNAANRAEEASFMANFDEDFAVRHAAAFEAISARCGLDYLPIDCGETPDGKLLLFEVGTAMIVHAMDPPDVYPYKRPQMDKVFEAFQAMLRNAAGCPL
jgi:hypothetical protein